MSAPKQGTIWQHVKSGGLYIVYPPMTRESDDTPLVAYQTLDVDAERTDIWVRPLKDFMERFRQYRVNVSDLAKIEQQRALEALETKP